MFVGGHLWNITTGTSDGQGFGKPQGYKGRGKEGKGQGKDFETPSKPLPFVKGQGSPEKGQGFSKKLLLYHQSAQVHVKNREKAPQRGPTAFISINIIKYCSDYIKYLLILLKLY